MVENPALDVRVQLPQSTCLAILFGHELLVQRRDLDVGVVRGQVEVRGEPLRGVAVAVPCDVERGGLISPVDLVEVEKFGELPLAVVGERDALVRKERVLRVD